MGKKLESSFKNMVLVLFLVTLVSSAAVGVVNTFTSGLIEKVKIEKQVQAIRAVVPEFDNDPMVDTCTVKTPDGGMLQFYEAKKGGNLVGTAVKTYTNNGFGGIIRLMAGFLPDGTIYRVETLSQSETPGLGDKMEKTKSDFALQFDNKNPGTFRLSVKKDGGDVDAITAATISSRAYTDAVARAYKVFGQITGTTDKTGKEANHE